MNHSLLPIYPGQTKAPTTRRSAMKRLVPILFLPVVVVMAVVSVSTIAFAQTPIRVAVTGIEVQTDSTATVPVSIAGAEGIVAMHVEITYDPAMLQWDGLENGDLVSSNSLVEVNPDTAGTVIIGIATLDPITGTGELLNPSFVVLGPDGTNAAVGLQNVAAWDENGFDVLLETQDGNLTIVGGGIPVLIFILIAAAAVVVAGTAWWLRKRGSAQPGGTAPTQVSVGQVSAPAGQLPAAAAAASPLGAVGATVFVNQPVTLVDSQQNQVGQLQPDRLYIVNQANAGWFSITDDAGNTGWAPASAVTAQPK